MKCTYCNRFIPFLKNDNINYCSKTCEDKSNLYFKSKIKSRIYIFIIISVLLEIIGIPLDIFLFKLIGLLIIAFSFILYPYIFNIIEKKFGIKTEIIFSRIMGCILLLECIRLIILEI